jgi:hypothetical protein
MAGVSVALFLSTSAAQFFGFAPVLVAVQIENQL